MEGTALARIMRWPRDREITALGRPTVRLARTPAARGALGAPACTTLIESSRRDPFLSPAWRALLEPSVVDESGFVSLPGFICRTGVYGPRLDGERVGVR